MLPSDTYLTNPIDTFQFNDIEKIRIIDKVKLDNKTINSFDIILNRYYRDRLDLLPAIYSFNNITDASQLYIGRIINIPDIDSLEAQLVFNKILDDDKIPGVIDVNNRIQNEQEKTKMSKTRKTALPKLNITQTKVSYDSATGRLTF